MSNTRNDLIRTFFNEGLRYSDILEVLRENHAISISLRHLNRILRGFGLNRRTYSEIPDVVDFLINEIETSAGRCHG